MKTTVMKALGISLSALLIGGSGLVFGQGGYGPGMMGGPGMMHGPGTSGPGMMRGGPMMGGPGSMMGGRGMGPGMMMGANPVAGTEQRLSDMHSALGIQPAQEPAWNAYAQAVVSQAALMKSHRDAMMSSGTMTPQQQMGWHQVGMAQRKKMMQARQEFYSALGPGQRRTLSGYTGSW